MPLFRVYAATKDDMSQGWVWLGIPGLPQRGLVRIYNPETCQEVVCEALHIDDNFLTSYNQPGRAHIGEEETAIVLNGWYRTRLQIATKNDVELTVSPVHGPSAFVSAAYDHPQTIVRISMKFAIWSIFLGVIGIILSCVGIFLSVVSLCQSQGR